MVAVPLGAVLKSAVIVVAVLVVGLLFGGSTKVPVLVGPVLKVAV